MAIGKIKASRVNSVDAPTYVGEEGILFYNFANGVIRLSDGTTPGGVPVPYTIASNTTIGGIKAGPGANVGLDGTLTIDTSGLPLSIGNLSFIDTTITTLNPNVNLNLVTNGIGNINLVGGVGFYKPNGPIDSAQPFFRAKNDGQLQIFVPAEDPFEGGVEIIGSATGRYITPGLPGTMLHITGNPNVATRFYIDGNAEYTALVARRYNGNVAAPTQVLAGQDVLRINSTAATNLNGGNVGNVAMAQIRTTALENQTSTAQGSSITFTVTPIGSPASARVDVANVTVANGVTATKFTTSGNVNAGNIIVTGSILGNAVTTTATIGTGNITTLNVSGAAAVTGNITAGNINITGAFSGHYTHTIRNAGTIADAGTVTLDFTTDDIVVCVWNNGLNVAYTNFIPGRSVRLIAQKGSGSGTDTLSLGNISANHTSTGSTTVSAAADQSYILEFFSTNTAVTGLYVKI
jgi:cytoskeletal protein CcmA (bactofilin family)